jgi:hypothetical protein
MKAELLFTATFDRVAATQATHEYLWDKANEYAEAFDGTEVDPRFPIYTRLFATRFRPGFDADPKAILEETNKASAAAVEYLAKCKGESPERLERNAEAEAEAEAQRLAAIADREAYAAKKEADAKAAAEANKQADNLLYPPTIEAMLITDLGIHGLAENAYKKAGLETVGDLLTYKSAKPLEEISGISARFETQTLEAIDKLRAKFTVKTDTTEAE